MCRQITDLLFDVSKILHQCTHITLNYTLPPTVAVFLITEKESGMCPTLIIL